MFASLYTNHFHLKVIPCDIWILKTVIVFRELHRRFWLFCQDAFLAETKCDCGVWKTGNFRWIWPGQGSQQLLSCRFLVGCFQAKAEVSQVPFPSLLSEKAICSNLRRSTASPKRRERKVLLSECWHHLGCSNSFRKVRSLLFWRWVVWAPEQSSLYYAPLHPYFVCL